MTCGDTLEPRELFKSIMDEENGRTLLKGASSENAHQFLLQIVKNNEARGKRVGYTFKRMGYNRKTAKRWTVMDVEKSCLRKKGMYVIFGKSKMANPKHVQLMSKLKKLERERKHDEILEEYAAIADGCSKLDHAVGIKVDDDLNATLICNGCRDGAKTFTMVNLADRMEDLCICYEYDLFEL